MAAYDAIAMELDGLAMYAPLAYDLADHGPRRYGGLVNGDMVAATGGPLIEGDRSPSAVFDGMAAPHSDFVDVRYTTRRNLVTNPSFEVDLTGWTNYGVGLSRARSDALGLIGSAAQIVTIGGSGAEQGAYFSTAVTPSQTYAAGAWVRGAPGMPLRIGLYEMTSAFVGIGVAFSTLAAAPNWTYITTSRSFGATGAQAYVIVEAVSSIPGDFLVDGVLLEQANSAGEYFDGSYPPDAGGWTGAAHASTSEAGPFANGATRTFFGVAYRNSSASADVLVGSRGGPNAALLRLQEGNNDVGFWTKSSTGGHVISSAWPGSARAVPWAFIFNETTDLGEFYADGVKRGELTEADTYDGLGSYVSIGAYGGGGDPFYGRQRGVGVVEGRMTPSDIKALAKAAASGNWG